ncbi:MAG: hypothetical protein V9G19_27690 [Tetrasphaera sp.]
MGRTAGRTRSISARLPGACERLMARVLRIKARNDRPAAEEMARRYVDGDRIPQALMTERYNAFPQVSFVYAVNAGE